MGTRTTESPRNAPEFERDRQLSLRCFEVERNTGPRAIVWAHYWDINNPAGHLNFVFVEDTGVIKVRRSFNRNEWISIEEQVDDTALSERRPH